jgi:hypothetical protein
MATKLDKPLRREIEIGDKAYTLVIDPQGLKLTEKGHRKGQELSWNDVLGGGNAAGGSWTPSAE